MDIGVILFLLSVEVVDFSLAVAGIDEVLRVVWVGRIVGIIESAFLQFLVVSGTCRTVFTLRCVDIEHLGIASDAAITILEGC